MYVSVSIRGRHSKFVFTDQNDQLQHKPGKLVLGIKMSPFISVNLKNQINHTELLSLMTLKITLKNQSNAAN